MDEIVVALRETRRAAGRSAPFTVVGGAAHAASRLRTRPTMGRMRPTLPHLRESEIQRLLTDNARLNERVMFLLKVIEREQPSTARKLRRRSAATQSSTTSE